MFSSSRTIDQTQGNVSINNIEDIIWMPGSDSTGGVTYNSRLDVYVWRIPNFISSFENEWVKINSPTFEMSIAGEPYSLRFKLIKVVSERYRDCLWFKIETDESLRGELTLSFFIGNKLEQHFVEDKTLVFHGARDSIDKIRFFHRDIITILENNDALEEETYLAFQIGEPTSLTSNAADNESLLDNPDEFESLLRDEEYRDISLNVEGKSLHAHKCVLKSRSFVFTELLEHEPSSIDVADLNYPTLVEMLRFLYAEKVKNARGLMTELLYAAERYGIRNLKILCENEIGEHMSPANVVKCLEVANCFGNYKLKDKSVRFISAHGDVVDKPEFVKELANVEQSLAFEVVQALTAS